MRNVLWLLALSSACGGGSLVDDASLPVDSALAQSDAARSARDAATDLASDGTTPFPTGTICNDTGTPRVAPAELKHIVVVLYENEDFGNVNGNAAAPYLSSLASACGYSTHFEDNCFATNLVSLPHYLALTSGSNCNVGNDSGDSSCIRDDGDASTHTLTTESIFAQAASWKSYQEGMPSACDKSSSGRYATKHNPAAYYSTLSSCSTSDVGIAPIICSPSQKMMPCTTPSNALADDLANDTLPAFSLVTPDLDNDMHDGTVTQADNWTLTYLPLVFASPAYLRGEVAVLLLWDEQSTAESGGATPNVFISPYITKGTVSSTPINHFAVLRAMETALGIGTYLGCASGTAPGGGSCPAGSTADVRAALGF